MTVDEVRHCTASQLRHSRGHRHEHSHVHCHACYPYQAPLQPRPMSTSHAYNYSPTPIQHQSHYSQTPIYAENNQEYKPLGEYRRASMPLNTQQTYQSYNSYSHPEGRPHSMQNPYYPPTMHQSTPRSATPNGNGVSLPPLSTIQAPQEKTYEPHTPTTANPLSATSLNQGYETGMAKYGAYVPNAQHQSLAPQPIDAARTGKRSYGSVFDSSHLNRPMHSGMRPVVTDQGREVAQIEAEDGSIYDEFDLDPMKMLSYRRADGSRQIKKCPSPILESKG